VSGQSEALSFQSVFRRIEEIICIAAISLLVLLPLSESFARIFLKTGVPASSGLMVHLLLVAGLFAGMITTRNNEHLNVALIQYIKSEKIKNNIKKVTCLISACVAVVIAFSSVSFVKLYLDGRLIGFIPDRVFGAVIPLAYFVIAFRFARQSGFSGWKIIFPVLAVLFGTVLSFPIIAKFIWGLELPDSIFTVCDNLRSIAYYSRIPMTVFFIVAALAGTPLFIIIGGLAVLLLFATGSEMDSVPDNIFYSLTQPSIIAIPLFTLVGFFLSESKAGERLVHFFRSLFSWLPGGIIIVTVIICTFFASFTGASGVTILALGGILYSILVEHVKYPENFSIGLLTSVGSIGLLFPPSLPIILVGATSQTNIYHMFLGGIIPGIILIIAMVSFGVISSVRNKIPVEKFDGRKALRGLKESYLEILLPVFLIAGYFSGVFSMVEIGAAAVLYIFIVEVLVHKDIALRDVPRVFIKAIPIIGGVLSILAVSRALSYFIIDTQVPANLANWMHAAISSKYVFLLILNLTLFLLGCIMEIFSAILIILPLIIPLGLAYGIDPVHLGIIFIVNMEVGFLTPPVGLNLFLASYRFKKTFVDIVRYVFPFLLVQLAVVFLVTYVPALSTWLPGLFGK